MKYDTKGWGWVENSKTARECMLIAHVPTSYLPFICVEKEHWDKYERGEKCFTVSFSSFSEEKPDDAGVFKQLTYQQVCEAFNCTDFEILPF